MPPATRKTPTPAPAPAPPTPPAPPAPSPRPRSSWHRALFYALVTALMAMMLGAVTLWLFQQKPTTPTRPPAVRKAAPAAKKAVVKPAVKPAPAATSVAPVAPTKPTTTVAAPVPQTINNYYSYSYAPQAAPVVAPSPTVSRSAPHSMAPPAHPSKTTTVNILSGNSFSLNILSGRTDRWNSAGAEEGGGREEHQAP